MKTLTVRSLVCVVCLAAMATASAQTDEGTAATQTGQGTAAAQTDQGTAAAQTDQGTATAQTDQGTATAQTDQGTAAAQTDQALQRVGDTPTGPQVQPAAQGPQGPQGPQRPQYQDLRYNEDWSHIKEVQGPRDFWDPIKYIQLNDRGWYMTLGGEIRERFDSWHYPNFGYGAVNVEGKVTPATWVNGSLQRYMFSADTHFGEHVRFFVQTQSALEFGKKGGPWYTDKDTFEIHQGFVDFRSSPDPKHYVTLRVGYQEIALGSMLTAPFWAPDHFVSTSDYFNTRRNFVGVTLTAGTGSWTWFAQGTKPGLIDTGPFTNVPVHGTTSWGGGFFAPNPFSKQGQIGVFYTALYTKRQIWQRGLGSDHRDTLGGRIEGSHKGWEYAYEGLVQLGTFGPYTTYTTLGTAAPVQAPSVGIRAWAVTTDDGFTFQESQHYPRIGLATSFTSGDSGHGNLGTFHPLFPDTAYSGKTGLVGPSNGYAVTPSFRFALTRRIYLINEWSFFWRQNIHDAIYTPALLTYLPVSTGTIGFIEKPGNYSTARYIGSQPGTAAMVTIDRHLTYIIAYLDFVNLGQFLKETPPAKRSGLFVTFLNYTF
jgi:Alginate export